MSIYTHGIIYCYTNIVTGKRYIGQTINPIKENEIISTKQQNEILTITFIDQLESMDGTTLTILS